MLTLIERLFRGLALAGATVAVAMLLLTASDVIGRSLFNYPIPGAYQLTELGMGCVIFLVLPLITYEKRHLCMGLLDRCLSVLLKRCFGLLNSILLSAAFLLVSWRLWEYAAKRAAFGETIGIFSLHTAPFFFTFSILAAVSAIAALLPNRSTSPPEPQPA